MWNLICLLLLRATLVVNKGTKSQNLVHSPLVIVITLSTGAPLASIVSPICSHVFN